MVPAYFERDENGIPQRWVEMMRASIRHIATEFSARRMVIDYFNTAYAPGRDGWSSCDYYPTGAVRHERRAHPDHSVPFGLRFAARRRSVPFLIL